MKKKRKARNSISAVLELPDEIVFDMPFISLRGRKEAVIENYKSVLEYSSEKIRIDTSAGRLAVSGAELTIKCIDIQSVVISGRISCIEFL